MFCAFCVCLIFSFVLNYKCQKSRHFVISNANLIKLHKIIIQDLLNLLTNNHVDRTIGSRVIPNLGVHTFADRQVNTEISLKMSSWCLENLWFYGRSHHEKWHTPKPVLNFGALSEKQRYNSRIMKFHVSKHGFSLIFKSVQHRSLIMKCYAIKQKLWDRTPPPNFPIKRTGKAILKNRFSGQKCHSKNLKNE